jgi:hypothetical protein
MPCGGFFLYRLPKWQIGRGTCQNGKDRNFVKESQKGCLLLQGLDDTMEA